MKYYIILLLISLLITQLQATLTIKSELPQQFKPKFGIDQTIDYQLLNDKFQPFWPQRSGELIFEDDGDFLCGSKTEENTLHVQKFVFFKRQQDCQLDVQVKNLFKLGASIAILSDCVQQQDQIVTTFDNHFIPVLCISRQDELLLKNLLEYTNQIILDFKLQPGQYHELNLILFIEDILEDAATLINKFAQINSTYFQGRVKIEPVYFFVDSQKVEYAEDNCLDENKRYCTADIDGDQGPAEGKNLAQEYLRQLCINQILGQKAYFDYIKFFNENCGNYYNAEQCGDKQLKKITSKPKILEQCTNLDDQGQIKILENNYRTIRNHKVYQWPTAYVQDQHLSSLRFEQIIVQLCLRLDKRSKSCVDLLNRTYGNNDFTETDKDVFPQKDLSTGAIVAIVLFSCIVTLLLVFFFYRRYVRQRLALEMKQKVGESVQQYMSFYQSEKQL